MRPGLVVALAAALVAAGAATPAPAKGDHPGPKAVERLAHDFAAAWNRHDASAMASFFAPDADLINPFGRVARGRQAIEDLFRDEHHGPHALMQDSMFAVVRSSSRMVADDVALAEWDVMLKHAPKGDAPSAPMDHHVTLVLVKRDGRWLVAAARPVVYLPAPAG